MPDGIVDPGERLHAEFERQLAVLREELAAATTRRSRAKVRQRIRRLQLHAARTRLTHDWTAHW